jgi:hypothetical protein
VEADAAGSQQPPLMVMILIEMDIKGDVKEPKHTPARLTKQYELLRFETGAGQVCKRCLASAVLS